jgi:diacylglycerol kinase family enzyme
MKKKKEISFIINPISGTHSKEEIPKIIDEVLDPEQFNYELRFTEYAGHASEIARECAEKGQDIVVAVGGDGTVNEVARSLTHTQTALGIIPCGSGNGLARHLCLPLDAKKAVETINVCKIEEFDYGVINELRQKGRVLSEDYEDTGTRVTVMLPQDAAGQIAARYGDMIQA